jgi:hypothetical protein
MVAVIDNWIPPAQRDTVRALAREIDDCFRFACETTALRQKRSIR